MEARSNDIPDVPRTTGFGAACSRGLAATLAGVFAVVLFTCNAVTGQCASGAVSGGMMPDADGDVLESVLWDPDGSGPQTPVVVFGGQFRQLGEAVGSCLAIHDPATQTSSAFGEFTGTISAMTVLANNDLVVGGLLRINGGAWGFAVVRWDGTSWQTLGNSLGFSPLAFAELPGGDLVVGGFGAGNPAVQRWDGVSWSPVGSALTGRVLSMQVMPNGDLIAGGVLMMAAGGSLARWDGTAWSIYAGDITINNPYGASVHCLEWLPNGDLLAAGFMQGAGGVSANGIARWDGVTWSPLGSGTLDAIYAVEVAANGDIFVGGSFEMIGGVTAQQVARWDGTMWHPMGSGVGGVIGPSSSQSQPVRTIVRLPGGDMFAGGEFQSQGGESDHVVRWDGTDWGQLRAGTGGAVLVSTELSNGDQVFGGKFTRIEGFAANHVVLRTASGWQALGSGADDAVLAVFEAPNGDLLVGGRFTNIGGIAATHIARWDGTAWHAVGGGLPGAVRSIAMDAAGLILAGGEFLDQIVVWDGLAWHGTGWLANFIGGSRPSLLVLPDGQVIGSAGTVSGGHTVRRWNGVTFEVFTHPVHTTGPLVARQNGDLVMASGNSVSLFDGNAWATVGGAFNQAVNAVLPLPGGDLLVGGSFTSNSGRAMRGLARWNGFAWRQVGTGANGTVEGLSWRRDGSIQVVGGFHAIGSEAYAAFAEFATSCPVSVVGQGTGCTGSGGWNELTARSLPWFDADYESVATGMPATGLVVEVLGLTATSQALSAIVPQGGAGCSLLVTPDLLRFGLPTAGEFAMSLSIPPSMSLVGATFRQQVLPLELDAQGAIVAVTASNALELTIGRF